MAPVVVFSGGGTGGHLTPGISVARALAGLRPDLRIVFLTTGRSAEGLFAADHSFERHTVPAVRWPRGAMEFAAFPFRWVRTRRAGAEWMRRLDPAAAVGLGGYGQYGPIVAAARRGVPVVLLEQNAVPGKANRRLARLAADVCCQWEAARSFFPEGTPVRITGNPVREAIFGGCVRGARERFGLEPDRRTLLVLGGSQGSSRLNQAMAAAVARGAEWAASWQVIHQAGPLDGDVLDAAYRTAGWPYVVAPFLDEPAMADALAAADLVVSRAGATTLAELTAVGRPAILFPLPSADRHQERNAQVLVEAGAARVVFDSGNPEKSGAELATNLAQVSRNGGTLTAMAQGSRRLGVRDAARQVATLVACRVDERLGAR